MWFRNFMLLFIALAVAEVFVLIEVGSLLGAPLTVALIILTGVIGVSLLKKQGFAVFNRLQTKMASGQAPAQEMIEGVLLIIAGAFLVTPGFVTDIIGFLCLTPPIRAKFAQALISLGWFKAVSVSGMGGNPYNQGPRSVNPESEHKSSPKNPDVIEGEYERKD